MKSQFTLTAVLTTLSPMHITEPGEHRITLNGEPASPPRDRGFPCPLTTKMHLGTRPLVSSLVDDSEGAGGASHKAVPCIPANSLRGQMRRQAARDIMEALLLRGEKLSINGYNVLQCGAASGRPDGGNSTVAEAVMADAHPYFGLFGGGPRLIRSNLRVDTALAITEHSLPYLRPGYEGAVNTGKMTSYGWTRRNDDAGALTDVELQTRILANAVQVMNEYQDAAAESRKARDGGGEEADEAARGVYAFNALEYVNPGTHFAIRVDVEGTEAQAGLMLQSLLGFVKTNRIGGGGRRGFGRFMLQSVTLTENGESHSIAGRLTEDSTRLEGRGAELIDAWVRARSELSAGDIESVSKPAVKPVAAKKGKAAAAAAAPAEA